MERPQDCPMKSWFKAMEVTPKNAKYAFCWRNGDPMTRDEFNKVIRKMFDDFGDHMEWHPADIKRLSFYTFRISLFVFLSIHCDFTCEKLRSLGGWSERSRMPHVYTAKAHYERQRAAAIQAAASQGVETVDPAPLMDFLPKGMSDGLYAGSKKR